MYRELSAPIGTWRSRLSGAIGIYRDSFLNFEILNFDLRESHRQEAQDVMGNGGAEKNIKVKEAGIS